LGWKSPKDNDWISPRMKIQFPTKDTKASEVSQDREDYEQFFTLSMDPLCVAGSDGYLKRVNPAFTQTLGYSSSELLSRPFLDFVHPEDVARTLEEMKGLSAGRPSLHFENRYRCKDGSWKWLAWNTEPFNEHGILYAVARDVTEKKNAEQAILQLNAELLAQTSTLAELNQELESFSYSVSHDLRAPLRAISGFAKALEEHLGTSLDPIGAGYLLRVRDAAERMGLLIDDLLKLSRLTRSEMNLKPVNLSEMAEKMMSTCRQLDPAKDIQFTVEPDIIVQADPALLEILMNNLIGNAWKFTSKCRSAFIEFGRNVQQDGTIRYFVKDNGVGFDERYRHLLFGAFQRLHSQRDFPGTGIGLATVRRIVRRHDGEVFATSVIHHGATFEFTLGTPNPCPL